MRMRTIACVGLAVLTMGTTAMAQTVTVSQAGGADHSSIQAALDAINATNGVADVIQILDSAAYEEQVVVGGLQPIDQSSGDFIGALVAQNRDPVTIMGPATGERPKFAAPPASLQAYGVFEDDLEDNFNAGLVFFGKDITFENVTIYQPHGNSAYGINGQGVDITFSNCLFQLNPAAPGMGAEEDFINFNNSDRGADYYDDVTNSVLFEDCVIDGTLQDGGKYNNTFAYYHGNDGPGLDGTTGYTSSFTFNGCTIMNFGDDLTRLRARGAGDEDISQIMNDCVIKDNDGNSLNFDGGGIKTVDGCVFSNNVNGPETDPTSDNGAIRIRGRSGRTGDVTIMNSIFSNNASFGASDDPASDKWAAVFIQNDGGDGTVTIDHCTFDGNGTGVRFADAAVRPRTALISNCIFSNHVGAAVSGDAPDGSYVEHADAANLDLTLTNNLFFTNGFAENVDIGNNVGAVGGDPMFAVTDALAPDAFSLSDDSPALGAASDGTDIGAWQSSPSSVRDFMFY